MFRNEKYINYRPLARVLVLTMATYISLETCGETALLGLDRRFDSVLVCSTM